MFLMAEVLTAGLSNRGLVFSSLLLIFFFDIFHHFMETQQSTQLQEGKDEESNHNQR